MKKMTIKEYAKKHKLSIFNVMKMVRAGSIKSETEVEEGKEIFYILEDEVQQKEVAGKIVQPSQKEPMDLETQVENLKKELQALRQEVAYLKTQLASK